MADVSKRRKEEDEDDEDGERDDHQQPLGSTLLMLILSTPHDGISFNDLRGRLKCTQMTCYAAALTTTREVASEP